MKLKNRILKVSEMITASAMENTLQFRHDRHQRQDSILECIQVLAPDLKDELYPALDRVMEEHNLSDALINTIKADVSRASYAIGIIAGLHLAGRHDLVQKFAEVYAKNTVDGEMWEYDKDGESILPKELSH
jgi:hypothetical protein